MASYYDVGTKAWQPDQAEGWVASEVTQKRVDGDKVKLVFALENGEVSVTCTMLVEIYSTEEQCRGRCEESRRRSPRSPKTP